MAAPTCSTPPSPLLAMGPGPPPSSPEAGRSLGSPACKSRLASSPTQHTETPGPAAHAEALEAHSTGAHLPWDHTQLSAAEGPSTKAMKRGHSRVPEPALLLPYTCRPPQAAGRSLFNQQACRSPGSASNPARLQEGRPSAWAQLHSSRQQPHNQWLIPAMWGHTPLPQMGNTVLLRPWLK